MKRHTKPESKRVIWGIRFKAPLTHRAGSEWGLCGGGGSRAHLHAVINVVYTGHATL